MKNPDWAETGNIFQERFYQKSIGRSSDFINFSGIWSGNSRSRLDQALEKTLELSDNNPMYLSRLAYGLGVSGDRARCAGILKQLKDLKKKAYVSPFSFAIANLRLGDRGKAIGYLEKAFKEKMYHMLLLKTDPLFDPVRSDPRIKKMLFKMGFSPD